MSADWNAAWDPLVDHLHRMKEGWPTRGWSWDARFRMVVSSFFAAQAAAAREAATPALPEEWTSATLAGAGQTIREVAGKTGGLRSGQRILASAPVEGVIGIGLWWPWGDGGTISLRVGLVGAPPAAAEACALKLRQTFAVTLD